MEGKQCGKKGVSMHAHHIPGYPVIPFVFPVATALMSATCALWMLAHMKRALQIIALANVLDELGDRLTDDEKAEIEERLREKLFSPCCC